MGDALCVSSNSIQLWRKCYEQHGIEALLEDKRGGSRTGQITSSVYKKIEKRLNNPTEGFKSYKEAQEWINTFGINIGYHAVNKYLKRNFKTKLKVGRKSHIDKDPAEEAVFKNLFQKLKDIKKEKYIIDSYESSIFILKMKAALAYCKTSTQRLQYYIEEVTFDRVKSICGNQFYQATFKNCFNV